MRLALGSCRVDLDVLQVERGDDVQPLTPREARLVEYLANRPGQAVSRDELLHAVWEVPEGTRAVGRAVDNALYRLRQKVEDDARNPRYLLTVRGSGYRLVCDVDAGWEGQPSLLGRAEVLGALDPTPSRPVWICGVAGIGKTSVARAWARRAAAIELSLSGVPADGALEHLAAVVGVPLGPGTRLEEGAQRIAGRLARQEAPAVVLDAAEVAPELCRLLAEQLDCPVLVTSRIAPVTPDAADAANSEVVALSALDFDAALQLFERAARRGADGRDRARSLVDALGGNPLALEVVARWSQDIAPDQVEAMLASGVTPVDLALQVTWDALHPFERRVWGAVSLLDETRFGMLVELVDAPPQRVSDAYRRLVASGLVVDEQPLDAVREHGLAQASTVATAASWTNDQWESSGTRAERDRVAGLFARSDVHRPRGLALLVGIAREALFTGPSPAPWLARARSLVADPSEVDVLEAAVDSLAGDHQAAITTLDAVLERDVSPELHLEARARRAWARGSAGELHEAIASLEAVITDAREAGVGALEAMAAVRLGSLLHRAGTTESVQRAVLVLERAAGLLEGVDDAAGAQRVRSSIGLIQLSSGNVDAARPHLEATVAFERSQRMNAALAQHLLNLGGLELVAGRPEVAQAHLEEASERCAELGDFETGVLAQLSLGVATRMAGDPAGAVRRLTSARVMAERLDNPQLTGVAWGFIALVVPDAALRDEAAAVALDVLADHSTLPAWRALLDGPAGRLAWDEVLARTAEVRDPFVQTARLLIPTA